MLRKNGRISLFGGALMLMLAVGAGIGAAQPPQSARTIMATPFEKDANGWVTIGDKTKTAVDVDTVTGKSSLRYDYSVDKGGVSALVLPANPNDLAGATAFRFAVKTDYPTTVVVALQERDADKDEGRYMAMVHSPGGVWQEVALAPTDFIRDENTAAKDTNNKLDLEKVGAVAVGDFLQIVAQGDDNMFTGLLGLKRGAHQLWLRDFRVTTESLPGAAFTTATDPRLDTFAHPQIGWLAVGGMKLSVQKGRPVEGLGLKAMYPYGPGKIAGMVRQLPLGRLAGKSGLQLGLASSKPTTILIQLEEKSGGKYNATVEVPGGAMLKTVDLKFSEFTASPDSKDDNGKLDLDKVKQIVLLDASGMTGTATEEAENTLYLSGLRAQ